MGKVTTQYWWAFVLGFLVVAHIFILRQLVFFPYPELFVYPYLTAKGLAPYAQIFDQHFPGLMFFPVNLHTLGMVTPEIARWWHAALISLSHIILYLIGIQLFKDRRKALLVNLIYLAWQPLLEGYALWIETFVTPILLLSLFFLARFFEDINTKKYLWWGGGLLGLAIMFKQVVVPLAAFVVLFVWWKTKSFRRAYEFGLAICIPIVLMALYFLVRGWWPDFVYWTYTFNVTAFAESGRTSATLRQLIPVFPFLGLSLLGAGWGVLKKNISLLLTSIFFVGSLFFAYARFDYIHIQPALAIAAIIAAYALLSLPRNVSYVLSVLLLFSTIYIGQHFYKTHTSDEVKFFGEYEQQLTTEVEKYSDPGDSIFALGTTPHIYYLTDTIPAGRQFVFQFPWFMEVSEDRILMGIVNDPPKVVIRDTKSTTGGASLIGSMQKINEYVDRFYVAVEEVEGTEIMVPHK